MQQNPEAERLQQARSQFLAVAAPRAFHLTPEDAVEDVRTLLEDALSADYDTDVADYLHQALAILRTVRP